MTRVFKSTAAFNPSWSSIKPTIVSRRSRLWPASAWLSWAATDNMALAPADVAMRLSAGCGDEERVLKVSGVNPLPESTRSTDASSSAPGLKPLRKSPLASERAVFSGPTSLPRKARNSSTDAKRSLNPLPSIRDVSWASKFSS